MIIVVDKSDIGQVQQRSAPTMSRVIQQWKGAITKKIGFSPWQKSFHDHIIRNDADYNLIIAEYIQHNPVRWREDRYYKEELS